jgi:pyruvate kinase
MIAALLMTKSQLRKTKIIVTMGPALDSEVRLEEAMLAGAGIFRLNMAHTSPESARETIRRIRAASLRAGREVAVMMDIKGPEIRTGMVASPITLALGESFDFTCGSESLEFDGDDGINSVAVNYRDLVHDVQVGDELLVDSGLLRFGVIEKHAARLRCRVLVPGVLASRRHVNLPGVDVNLPAFTTKDRADAAVGLQEGVDYLAQSFVRRAADVHELRAFIMESNSRAQIIAKIEDQSGIRNLDEIVEAADAVMVARGDLGIECPYEDLPIIQRRVVNTCIEQGRPVIIATHMLESMISAAMPTRAEISDVANAVYEQADAVMLSGETAMGQYPIESIRVLDKIARRIEGESETGTRCSVAVKSERMKMLHSAVALANRMPGAQILAFTRQGLMAAGLAALRPIHAPILAVTPVPEVFRQLHLHRAVVPFHMPFDADPDVTIERAISMLRRAAAVSAGDKLVIVSDIIAKDQTCESIQLRVVR